jgi:hypothetical protein
VVVLASLIDQLQVHIDTLHDSRVNLAFSSNPLLARHHFTGLVPNPTGKAAVLSSEDQDDVDH